MGLCSFLFEHVIWGLRPPFLGEVMSFNEKGKTTVCQACHREYEGNEGFRCTETEKCVMHRMARALENILFALKERS